MLLLLVQGQALLVDANAGLVCLGALLDFGFLELDERVGTFATGHLLLHRAHFLHVHRDLDRDHAFLLDSRHQAIGVGAVGLEQLGFNVLFGLQAHVIQDVLLQFRSRHGIGLQNGRQAHHQVRCNVRVVLLAGECLELHAVQDVAVLRRGVTRRVGVLGQQHTVDVADIERGIHAVVGLVHVVHVRGALGELQLHLCELDALRRAEDVGVSHWLHAHHVVEVRLLDLSAGSWDVVWVLVLHVLAKALKQQAELKRLCVVQALVDAGHDHGAALQQCQGRSDLCVLVAVANLHVGGAGQALAGVHKEAQERKQHLAGLFVWQRQQRG